MSSRLSIGNGLPISKTQDEGRLAELGYNQELKREWGLLHNFGASFSIIVRLGSIISSWMTSSLTKR